MRKWSLFCLLLMSPSVAYAEPGWKWIGGDVSDSGWTIVQGSADVEIKAGRLDAKLYDGERLAQSLKGTIASGQVKIIRRVYGSDVNDDPMRGTYAKVRDVGLVSEVIIVQTPVGFVGITRTVQER